MTILDFINTDLLLDEMYSRIDEQDCVTLSKYIYKCNNISVEDVAFMYNNGISLSNETIIQGARELFGEEFYLNSIYTLAKMN